MWTPRDEDPGVRLGEACPRAVEPLRSYQRQPNPDTASVVLDAILDASTFFATLEEAVTRQRLSAHVADHPQTGSGEFGDTSSEEAVVRGASGTLGLRAFVG